MGGYRRQADKQTEVQEKDYLGIDHKPIGNPSKRGQSYYD